jgi:acyl-CoA thioesterase
VSREVGAIDGVSSFVGIRWDSPTKVRMPVRPDLINAGGLLSGVATYALVDYCMGSTLWVETADDEGIATLNISINYLATATEGEVICESRLDRRNRHQAVLRSEVRADDGRLLATAIGSYSIFARRRVPSADGPAV